MQSKLFVLLATLLISSCDNNQQNPDRNDIFVPQNDIKAEVIRFGVVADGPPIEVTKEFSPILRNLEQYIFETTGDVVTIKLVLSRTYGDGIDAIVDGNIDFSRFDSASYVKARQQDPTLTVLAVEEVAGETARGGIVIVRDDSNIQTIDQLVGKSFAFGDEGSTVGRYLAQQYLVENGITASDFKKFDYLGRHDKIGLAVAAGQYDAGTISEKRFNALRASGVRIRELARFENITRPWFANKNLNPNLADLIQEGLLQLDQPKMLSRLQITGFTEGSNSDYQPIRESIVNNQKFFEGYTNPGPQ